MKRKVGKKGRMALLKKVLKKSPAVIGVAVVIYIGLLLRNVEFPTLQPVTDVQVNGDLRFLHGDDIMQLVKANVAGGYFTVDLDHIRSVLVKQPWVKRVSLRRQWPAGITVYVEEQEPVAFWNSDAYLSAEGNVFKPGVIDSSLNLPNLSGPVGHQGKVWRFMNILYRETAMLNYEVVRLNLDDRRAWQLVLAESNEHDGANIKIKLGRFDTEKRLQRFVHILPALTSEHGIKNKGSMESNIKVIDMRYPNGFAVQSSEA